MAQNLLAVATMNPKVLYSGQPSTTADTAVYTVPGGDSAIVKHGTICNVTPSQTALTTALTTGGAITSMAVAALPAALATNAQITLSTPGQSQTFVVSAPASVGATSVSVNSLTPTFAFPIGTAVAISAGVQVQVTLSVVPSGGSADGTHAFLWAYPLNPGDTLSLLDYLVGANLGPGDSIHAQCSVASAVDITITGLEST